MCYIATVTGRRAEPSTSALAAWARLEKALEALERDMVARFGVTVRQLRLLREISAREPVTLAELRGALGVHPATLGQLADRIARRGLVAVSPDPRDRRRRVVQLTPAGRRLLRRAPQAGPDRLAGLDDDPRRLRRAAAAFADAVDLFGLTPWGGPPGPRRGRGAGARTAAR